MSQTGTLFVWHTENQRRVLHPMTDRNHERGFFEGIPSPFGPQGLRRDYFVAQNEAIASRLLHELEEFVVALHPCQVVLASTHSIVCRGLALVCRWHSIPSIYIPHAPTFDGAAGMDLPFDRALLWGHADRDFYLVHQALAEGIHVVGNPGIDELRAHSVIENAKDTFLVAPSSWKAELVQDFFQAVNRAVGEPYVVAPHPRSNLGQIRKLMVRGSVILPKEVRTLDLLNSEGVTLIQGGSGVALEGLLSGCRVIDVWPPDKRTYIFFRDAPIEHLATLGPGELHKVDGVSHQVLVQARVHFAGQWVKAVGDDSRSQVLEVLACPPEPGEWVLNRYPYVS